MEKKSLLNKEGLSALVGRLRHDSRPTELISGNGKFNETGLRDFTKSMKLHECGVSYAVVAIMGPQSSGKSTLLNHLFHTSFKEMNALNGRSQTTKGVWIAKAPNMEPVTLVVDLEGTDGLERGEDDTAFEKQSALFALAVADIVLINMWCHDIGREHAGNRPLLKTIFEVMMRLFNPREKKTTLFFVLRDKTKSPFETLEALLRKDVEKIWKSVIKLETFEDTPLSDFFNVRVAALPSYEEKEEQFKEQVALLRQLFFHSISSGGVAGDRRGVVPASGFYSNAEQIWNTVQENKDLNLPAIKVMVATVRCEEIAKDKLRLFASNKDWLKVEKEAETRLVLGLGADINSILRDVLLEYDSETKYFEENVRNEKRQYLKSEALKLVRPVYTKTLSYLRSEALQTFESGLKTHLSEGGGFAESVRICQQSSVADFDQRCSDAAIEGAEWDASVVRNELIRDIETQSLLVRTEKLPQVVDQCRERVSAKIDKELKPLFIMGGEMELTWAEVRSILKRESDAAALALSFAVASFELDQAALEQMVNDIKKYAKKLVERRFKEETKDVVGLMKKRFIIALQEKDGEFKAKEADIGNNWVPFLKCLRLMSTMAVLRFEEMDDDVERVLQSELMGSTPKDIDLASSAWKEVPAELTLITPSQCKDIWIQFVSDMENSFKQANEAEEKCKKSNHWSPPSWVTTGLAALGLRGFMALLRDHCIDFVVLVGALAKQGIVALEEGFSILKDKIEQGVEQIKDFANEFRSKCGELMKKVKKALKKFYAFIKDIFA